MHGQGHYITPVGQDPYVRPPALQPQVYQHGPSSFHPARSLPGYHHAPPSVPHLAPPAPAVSGGLGSGQSYLPHHRPPHINTHTSHPYPTSEQQWSQNVHQLPSAAPFPGPSGYQLPSSQGHSLGRGPFHQPPSAPPSLFPHYSSSSSALMSDSFGSSVPPTQEHSCQQPVIPVLPPPPPLPTPPPPTSSPPIVPPIPPSSPPLDIGSKGEGDGSLNGSVDGNNLIMERPYSLKPAEDRSAYETEVLFQHTEKSGTKAGSVDAVAAHSPTDSDMDMEDDITHPDEERKNCLSINVNGEHVPKSEDYAKEQLQASHHAGELTLVHENSLLAEASVSKAERGGSEIASFYSTMKVTSETDDTGMFENGQNEHPLDVSVEDSSIRHDNFRQPCVPVLLSETVNGKLSDQAMEGANPFKLLQGDVSDNTSENDEENLLTNVSSRSANDGSSKFDAETGCDFGSKLRHATLTESSRQILSKSMVESPKNVTETDKLSVLTHIVEGVSDRRHRGVEPVNIRDVSPRIKDSRNYDDSTGLESASLHKADVKCSSSKPNVDEFGRLVREGVSDSDTSDSPRYARRRARRTRKRSRSQSRSRSPHDRRRRRSPWRRKARHSWSRSLSPKKRRSRSRMPVLQRDSEFGGDKLRREKGQIPGCFDFLRGKCYRGATCRYSHHESDKNERSRYNWDKQHFRDGSHRLQSPDFHEESKVLDEEIKYRRSPADMPVSKEAKSVMRPLDDSTTDSPSILGSLGSGSLLVADVISSNHSNEIPQTGSVVSESSTWAMAATSTHYPADIPDAKQGPTSHLSSVGAPITSSNPTEEVPSQSLKELLPSIANHLPHSTIPMPSALQTVSAPFAQPITQDYKSNPPIPWNHMIPENNSPYQAPAAYQHSHFQGLSKPLSSSFVQLPLPPPPPPPPAAATGERSISLVHMQQSKLPAWNGLSSYTSVRSQPTESPFQSQTAQYQANSLPREPNQMLNIAKNFGSGSLHVSNLMARQDGPHRVVEDRFSGPPVQAMNPSLAQAQPNTLQLKSFVAGGLPSGSVSNYRPYFQHASYGMQHSAAVLVPASHAELGMVSSSTSRITPEFFETNRPSYARDFLESRSSNYLNTCASTFDLPQSSKFSSNVLIQDNHTAINTEYGAPVGMSTTPVDAHKIGIVGSENRSVLPRVSGDQYDPLFDYIEPASNSFSKAGRRKHEITGDSDEVLGFIGSGRVLNMKSIKQEGGSAASANDSLENEECGETADIEVDGVLNATPSNPNDATNMDAGDIEIDQVKTYGKKKKSKERSMKHFKISIATFVKEVLKPSWRQGNMSKEAFKTIVKKTVDKVSEAMKSHQIPKSQAKINHYIDSSRGKLTKLVMGYVDKYVKV